MGEEGRKGRTKGAIGEPVIEPKRGGGTVDNFNKGDRSKSVEFISNNFPKVAVSTRSGSIKGSSVTKQPVFPRNRFMGEEFVDELHNQATVLKLQILDAETTIFFPCADILPSNKTL
jgi:hypothetical protein